MRSYLNNTFRFKFIKSFFDEENSALLFKTLREILRTSFDHQRRHFLEIELDIYS